MAATEHDLTLGWIRLLSGGLSSLFLSSTYLARFWRDPEGRFCFWIMAVIFALSVVGVVQAWQARLVIRLDDEGIQMFPRPLGLFARLFGTRDHVPPILWAKVRSMRFETPSLDQAGERTLLIETEDGERKLVLVAPGAARLKDPVAFLAALRSRGWDLTWPEDARWKIVPFSG